MCFRIAVESAIVATPCGLLGSDGDGEYYAVTGSHVHIMQMFANVEAILCTLWYFVFLGIDP